MRWEQIAGLFVSAAILASPTRQHPRSPAGQIPRIRPPSSRAAGRAGQPPGSGTDVSEQIPIVHRVALIIPEFSADPAVTQAVAVERTMLNRRHRPSLLAPRQAQEPKRQGSRSPKTNSGRRGVFAGAGPDHASAGGDAGLSPSQLQTLAGILFADALGNRLNGRVSIQTAPLDETTAALKLLRLSPADVAGGKSVTALCRQLNCDSVLIPTTWRTKTHEAGTRAFSMFVTLKLFHMGSGPDAADRVIESSVVQFPAGGSSTSERAPFQDRFLKPWPQLAGEAARQAAAVTARTLVTGSVGPFMADRDTIAVFPVAAPSQADALIFRPTGRTVLPGALKQLPINVSSFFHPELLPLFPDSIISPRVVAAALAGDIRSIGSLWTNAETPNAALAATLGRRLKVRYVLLARVSDLQVDISDDLPHESTGNGDAAAGVGQPSATVSAQDNATAEAIGALVRVSDAAVLWSDRTTATMSAHAAGSDTDARKRLAFSVVRFSLVQLERRFRQYRHRFE